MEKRIKTAKESSLEMLALEDGDDEKVEKEEDEPDNSRSTSRGNHFILTSYDVSRKRQHESDSE